MIGQPVIHINDLDLEVLDVIDGKPIEAKLNLELSRWAKQGDKPGYGRITLNVKTTPLDLKSSPPCTIDTTSVEVGGMSLGFLHDWVPTLPVSLKEAVFGADLESSEEKKTNSLELRGSLGVKGIQFPKQAPLDVSLSPNIALQMDGSEVDLKNVVLRLPGFEARLSGKVFNKETTNLQAITLNASIKDIAALLKTLPGTESVISAVKVDGPLDIVLKASGTPTDISYKVSSDLTNTGIQYAPSLQKGKGAKLALNVEGRYNPSAVDIKVAGLDFGPLSVRSGGRWYLAPKADQASKIEVKLEGSNIRSLSKILPAVTIPASGPSDLRGRINITQTGDKINVDVPDIFAQLGQSDIRLKANASLVGQAKIVRFDLNSNHLNVAELTPPASEEKPVKEPPPEPSKSSGLEGVDVEGNISIRKVTLTSGQVGAIEGKLLVKNEEIVLPRFRADILGGGLRLDGTKINMSKPSKIKYDFRFAAQKLQLAEIVRAGGLKVDAQGPLDLSMALAGEGTNWENISKSLTGNGNFLLGKGRVNGVNILGDTLKPVVKLAKVTALRGASDVAKVARTSFKSLKARFAVADGKVLFRKPLHVNFGGATAVFGWGDRFRYSCGFEGFVEI